MSNNLYLHEKRAEDHMKDMQREIQQARLAASATRTRRNRGKHVISRLGSFLVAFGTWLEQAEPERKQIASPATHN